MSPPSDPRGPATAATQHDRVATAWNAEYARGRYADEPPVPFVGDILATADACGLRGARGLYVGCGNGRNFVPLLAGGLDLIGLDVAPTAVAQLRSRLPDGPVRAFVGDLHGLRPEARFDVVIGIQVFQHGDRRTVHDHVRRAQRLLRPGGLFCVRVNAVGTDVWPAHDLVEDAGGRGCTVRYVQGPKAGLLVHFFAREELEGLFADDFAAVLPLRPDSTPRRPPAPGQWKQWEAIWRRHDPYQDTPCVRSVDRPHAAS